MGTIYWITSFVPSVIIVIWKWNFGESLQVHVDLDLSDVNSCDTVTLLTYYVMEFIILIAKCNMYMYL